MSPRRVQTSPHCPACDSTEIVPVIYGEPPPELVAEAERGEVVLGGCVRRPGQATHACRHCGVLFREIDTEVR